MFYSNMKLHVSAYNGHRQVSIPIKGILYIWVGGVDVEISMHQFPVALLSGASSYVQFNNKFKIFSSLSLVTHTTGMTHLKFICNNYWFSISVRVVQWNPPSAKLYVLYCLILLFVWGYGQT